MFVSKEPPDDGDILDDDVKRDGAKGAANAEEETQEPESVEWERFEHPEHVHVDIDGGDEGAEKI